MTEENLTPSLEDYLEAFYELVENKQGARAVDIAKKLNKLIGRIDYDNKNS